MRFVCLLRSFGNRYSDYVMNNRVKNLSTNDMTDDHQTHLNPQTKCSVNTITESIIRCLIKSFGENSTNEHVKMQMAKMD